jgi:L-ascorbate metabolism protein UlaG (beta-lactamase superfamily)
MLPEETVIAGQNLHAKTVMPMHWGRYVLSVHPWNESVERVQAAAKEAGQSNTIPRIGEYYEIGSAVSQDEWWKID